TAGGACARPHTLALVLPDTPSDTMSLVTRPPRRCPMRLLIFFAMLLLPMTAFAQTVPALSPSPFNSVTQFRHGPFGYQSDSHNRSTQFIETGVGTYYQSQDRSGRVTSEG